MLVSKLFNSSKQLMVQPAFCFSAKKKQIELTLRTPYRTHTLIQKPSSKTSQASPKSSPKTSTQS